VMLAGILLLFLVTFSDRSGKLAGEQVSELARS
jgi:hypothetical protein